MKADIERRQNLTPEQGQREQLPSLFSQEFINSNPEFCEQYVTKAIEFPAPLQGFIRQSEAILRHDTYERLPDVNVPTLVIAGDADRIAPVENLRLLASKIPNAELVILKGMGHGFRLEAEDETNRIVLDFIKRHSYSS